MSIADLKQRLTWHDPLADQFLSCASLLEFELEDCMETEEVTGEKEEKRESVTAGENKKLQRWSSELLKASLLSLIVH